MISCATTGVGSLPFKTAEEAVAHVFSNYDIPFLPQLPRKSSREMMVVQFMEDFPGFKFTPTEAWIELDEFRPLDLNTFKFSYVSSLALFLKKSQAGKSPIKLQMTGPYTIANSLLCSDRKLIIDHEPIYEYLLQFIQKKAIYLASLISHAKSLMLILDEPMLNPVVAGPIFQEVAPIIIELKKKIQIVGMHSCNLWTPELFLDAFESEFNALSFDFEKGGEEILEDEGALLNYLNKGWVIWGVIPTYPFNPKMDEQLFSDFLKNKRLKKEITEAILFRSMFSPACGTGTLTIEQEKSAVQALNKIASVTKERSGSSELKNFKS